MPEARTPAEEETMTENIPELIAEARANVERAADAATGKQAERIRAGEVSDDRLRLLVQLADALEAVTAENESLRRFDWIKRNRRIEAERDAAYAVIEKVRAEADSMKGYGEPAGENFDDILSTVPADALREVKAQAWDEGARRVTDWNKTFVLRMPTDNPYRYGDHRG